MGRFDDFDDANSKVGKGATAKEVVKKKTRAISIPDVDVDDYEYIQSTGIPITRFARMAIKEKRERDEK